MELRPAEMNDLPQLTEMYAEIIDNMNKNNIPIWDEIYPCCFFREDIEQNRLFVMTEGDVITSAFALCGTNSGEGSVDWENPQSKALYIDRLGVRVSCSGRGIGSRTLREAERLAKSAGAAYLRLFVVDINKPAINLYLKCGFSRAGGIFEEKIDDFTVLREYGVEKRL